MVICIKYSDYSNRWHCFVGRHFASYVTHEKGKYMYYLLKYLSVDTFILVILVYVCFLLDNLFFNVLII